jgi:spore maturation protein CgeB
MLLFDATGCGALLITEYAANLYKFFDEYESCSYESPREAVLTIKSLLLNDEERRAIAKKQQQRTLRDHTYAQRMRRVSETLMVMLCMV